MASPMSAPASARDEAGQLMAPVATSADVTSMQRTIDAQLYETARVSEARLRNSEQMFRTLAETVAAATFIFQGPLMRYVNPAAERLTGYTRDELLAMSFETLFNPDNDALALRDQPLAKLPQAPRELRMRTRDGAERWVQLTLDAMQFADQPATLSTAFDITERKRAERLKDQFIANVSHELRTPLSVITLFSGNLERSYELLDTAQRRRIIRGIGEQTQVLDDLINGVLELARIDGRRVNDEHATVELDELARAIVAQQRPLARMQGLRVRLHGGPLRVQGNAGQIRQVLQNLLNNAIKYSAAGGRISCTWRAFALPAEAGRAGRQWPGSAELPPGRWAALKVTDTGIGIAPADQARIFERFFRVKAQGRVPGTGLGLAIVQELVQLHGGQVALASTPGHGSSFAVYLPLTAQ